jgi:4-hydroxy-tetrahydrodipicolinate synthase
VLSLIPKGRHFELLAGSDAQIVLTMFQGGTGILSLLSCVFPKLIVEVCEQVDKGDWDEAIRVQQKILRVRQGLKVGPFMAAYKYASTITGSPLGQMKYPLSELSEKEKASVREILEEQKMI